MTVEHQVIIIYAVVNNYLKDIPINQIAEYQVELFELIDNSYPDIIKSISETKELTKENEAALKSVLEGFSSKYMQDK